MRKISIDKVKAGTKIAKNVISLEGAILLSVGVLMQEEYKRRLFSNGITEIYIEDEMSQDIEIPELIKNEIRLEARNIVKEVMKKPTIAVTINGKKVAEIVDKIIENILSCDQILVNLTDIRSVDDYTFEHSVNVCIFSLIIGIGIGLDGEKLKDLGTGSLLHDIGKLLVSEEILKKPTQLAYDEFEEIKKHTIYGFDILKNHSDINMAAAYIALGHHERVDGSGYPMRLKNDNIHQCARIVAIADVYDALTSDRVYRKKLRPHEVVEYIVSLGGKQFDLELVNVFIKYVAHYPIGSGVILNSNERGLVSRINKSYPTRPVIRVVQDENGRMLLKHKEIDLSDKLNYHIVDVWEI